MSKIVDSFKDLDIWPILEKVLNGEDLSINEIEYLLKSEHIHALGYIASELARRFSDDVVTVVNNFVINYTNICVCKCPLCAFHRDFNDPDAYVLKTDDVIKLVTKAVQEFRVTEIHFNGGCNPELSIEYFESIFKEIKKRFQLVIKGLTAAEIWYYSRVWRMSYKEVIERLKEAGMDVISGGGAEIFNPEVRKVIAPNKVPGDEWLRIIEIAHELGMPSNATILYGHIEKPIHVAEHLVKIRELLRKTGKILLFIPLKFSPWNTELYRRGYVKGPCPSTYDLKIIAVSRIVLKNVKIGAYWVSLGKKLAQVALNYGADDLVGTMINERVFREAGRQEVTTLEELSHLVQEVGKRLAERDTFHKIIRYL